MGYLVCVSENGQVEWLSQHKTIEDAQKVFDEKAMLESDLGDEEVVFIIETKAFYQKLTPVE